MGKHASSSPVISRSVSITASPSDRRPERSGFGPFLFNDWKLDPAFVLNQAKYAGASVLAAGINFGCGSSREDRKSTRLNSSHRT